MFFLMFNKVINMNCINRWFFSTNHKDIGTIIIFWWKNEIVRVITKSLSIIVWKYYNNFLLFFNTLFFIISLFAMRWGPFFKRPYATFHAGSSTRNLFLKEADQKTHPLLYVTSCEKLRCLENNCVQVSTTWNCYAGFSRLNIMQIPTGFTNNKVETRVVGNLTHGTPAGKDYVSISNVDYEGNDRTQNLVIEKALPKVKPYEVVVNVKASSSVQSNLNHNSIMATSSVVENKKLIKELKKVTSM